MQGRDTKKARIYFTIALVLLLLAFALYLLTRDADPDEIVVEGNVTQECIAQFAKQSDHPILSDDILFV